MGDGGTAASAPEEDRYRALEDPPSAAPVGAAAVAAVAAAHPPATADLLPPPLAPPRLFHSLDLLGRDGGGDGGGDGDGGGADAGAGAGAADGDSLASSGGGSSRRSVGSFRSAAAADLPDLRALNRNFLRDLLLYVRQRPWQKKAVTAVFLLLAVLVYADLLWGDVSRRAIHWFLGWLPAHTSQAFLAFVAVFVLTTVVFVPPFLLTFGAGFVFAEVRGFGPGVLLALAACFVGSVLGAVLAFLRARYLTRDLVKLFSSRYPLLRAVDGGLKTNGFRVMLLLRLCSVIPFSALNYMCGVTGVHLGEFVLSLVGLLPSQLLIVAFGAVAAGRVRGDGDGDGDGGDGDFAWTRSDVFWASATAGWGVLAVVVTVYISRRELRKELRREEAEAEAGAARAGAGGIDDGYVRHDDVGRASGGGGGQGAGGGIEDEEWFWVWA